MAKLEHQIKLIEMLREFTGRVPTAYASQMEFFIIILNNMSEHLVDLKKETLKETCDNFCAKLDRGSVSGETLAEFKSSLDKLVSEKDFRMVCGFMIGSKGLIRKRLSELAPVSLLSEERKRERKDPDADRYIAETYSRLGFASLVSGLLGMPDERATDAALLKAREAVAEYCCLYRIPLNESDTLSPFSLSCVDAVISANYRLLSNIRKARAGGK